MQNNVSLFYCANAMWIYSLTYDALLASFFYSLVMEWRLHLAYSRKELLNNCIVHASWCSFTLITNFQWEAWMVSWISLCIGRNQRHEIRPSEHISSVCSVHISFRSMLQIHMIQFIRKCQVSAHKTSIKEVLTKLIKYHKLAMIWWCLSTLIRKPTHY